MAIENTSLQRRTLIKALGTGLALSPFALKAMASPLTSSPSGRYAAYVSNAKTGNVYSYIIDEKTHSLTTLATVPTGAGAGTSDLSPDGRLFYVANHGNKTINTFRINRHTGELTLLQTTHVPSEFMYIKIDTTGRYLIGASYAENRVVVLNTEDLKTPHAEAVQIISNIPHAHSVLISPDDKYVYIASLKSGRLIAYAFNNTTGHLTELESLLIGKHFGTRHQYLSNDGRTLYVLSEFSGQVAEISRNRETGLISLVRISAVPDVLDGLHNGFADAARSPQGTAGLRWASNIHVPTSGRYFYISDRTSNTIITLDHQLNYVSAIATERQPRAFNITPDGKFLLASGELSDHVSLYSVNPTSGRVNPTPLARLPNGMGADWVEIVALS